MQLPADLAELVQQRLASGAYANAEDVVRRALEAQEAEEIWTLDDRQWLASKIDRALEQVATGRSYSPDAARQKLAALRESHLADTGR